MQFRLTLKPSPYQVGFRWLLTLVWVCIGTEAVHGQKNGGERYAVDVVNLKNRKQIRGFVLNPNGNDDVRIAVSREWLKKNDREQYTLLTDRVKQDELRARQDLQARLKNVETAGKHPAFDFFIRKERERIDKLLALPDEEKPLEEESQFLTVTVKRPLIASSSIASEPSRKVALWAWSERFDKVETRSPKELATELMNKKLDPSKTPPDLANRFPTASDTEDQWNMRLAIVSHGLAEKIEFQGSGDVMMRVGDDNQQAPDLTALMGNMMQNQVTSLIEELTGGGKKSSKADPNWIKAATVQAEKLDSNYFRATHVALDPSGENARVESVFMVKLPDGLWKKVWKSEVEELASNQSKESIARLMDDPQVQSIRETMKSLGGVAGLNDPLEKALRFGSATMKAQEKTNEEFTQFQSRFLRQLDEPKM